MVDSVQTSTTNQSTLNRTPPAANTETNQSVVNSDFETFIKMLTAQVENQDPLNPIESTDFATQLATFSGVEQQVLTNELLTSLTSQFGAGELSEVSGWIGMEARAITPVTFDGTPVKLSLAAGAEADKHELVVRDTSGSVVAREEISGQRQTILWPGTDAFGNPLPPGTYDVSVVSFSNDTEVAQSPAEVHGRILEARLDGTSTRLVLSKGQEISPEDVLGLRQIEEGSN
ncbi:MAG: flagellar hook capping FlgD N-terminal domain-containing protein [Pseudomonadota bacterium]